MSALRRALLLGACLSMTVPAAAEDETAAKPRLLHTLEDPTGRVCSLSFSTDGRRLLTGGIGAARLWDVESGKEIAKYEAKEMIPGGAVLSPDGRMIAVEAYSSQAELLVLKTGSGEVVQRIPHPKRIAWYAFGPDGKTLVSGSDDRAAHIWVVATGEETCRMPFLTADRREWAKLVFPAGSVCGWSQCGLFSPDGKAIAVELDDGSVWLYDTATGKAGYRLFEAADENQGHWMAFTPDGRFLATGMSLRNTIRMWDIDSGKVAHKFRLMPDAGASPPGGRPLPGDGLWPGSRCAAFSPDGQTLAVCCNDGADFSRVRLLEVATGGLRCQFDEPRVSTAAFAPVGNVLATADGAGAVHLWDWRDLGQSPSAPPGPEGIDRLWNDLAAEDPAAGYKAVLALIGAPEQAVPMLKRRVKPVEPVSAARINHLLSDLESDDFDVREEASRQLKALGQAARPAIQQALKNAPSAESRHRCEQLLDGLNGLTSPDVVRAVRAIEALEAIGTGPAKEMLRELAGGADGAAATDNARAALRRMEAKQPSP